MNEAVPATVLAIPRILVIDDNRAIHDDFRKIFGTGRGRAAPSAAERALFGGDDFAGAVEFRVDFAHQGEEGLALVRLAHEQEQPFAMAFVDVRMPPGWDGIETTEQICRHDPDIQIVICTAYSDYSWSEMLARLGRSDRLVILKKPFDTIEVLQLASALSEKWRLARESRTLLEDLEGRVAERTIQLQRAAEWLKASEAQYRLLFEGNPHPMWVYDRETLRFLMANAAATRHYGYSNAQFCAMTVREIEQGDDRHRKQDGSLIDVEISSEPIVFDGRPACLTLSHDVTERKQADEKIRRLNRVYAVLSGINTLIVRVRDRDELFREACRVAIEAGGFRMAWVGLLDRAAGVVKPMASAGDVRDFFDFAPLAVLEDKPGGHGLAGRVIRARAPIVSHDVQNDPHRLMKRELAERGINSVALIPLIVEAEAIGVLALYAAGSSAFDENEMRLLVELAGDIAFAIEHIEKAEKLTRMTRVNAMLSGINAAIVRIRNRRELFEEACRIAVETGGLSFAWFGVVDEVAMRLRPVASAGTGEGFLEMIRDRLSLRDDAPAGHGIAARSVREGRATVLHDVDVHPYPAYQARYAELGVKTVAALPLMVAGRAVGAFGLLATEAGFFDDNEMKLLNEVASNIAFALEHIDKEEKVQRLTRVYAVLSGINALIVRARDRDELFREACRIAVGAGGFRLAWVAVVDRSAMRLELAASEGAAPDYLAQMPLCLSEGDANFGLAGRAVNQKSPVIVDDMEHDPRVLLHRQAGERGFHSLVMLPLIVSDTAVGVLALYAGEIGFFNADEMKLLRELAGDIAFALQAMEARKEVEYLSYYDPLTGLANRRLFLERLAQYKRAATGTGHKLALFLLDLERFKNINDSLGRPAGDALLRQVTEWLTRRVGDANLVARVGADVFAVVLPEVRQDGNLAGLVEKSAAAFMEHPYRLGAAVFRVAVKVGVSIFPDDGADAETLFRNAEAALKKAKARGERYLFYKAKMTDSVAGKLTLENQLRRALDNEEFVLHYQPKVSLANSKLTGAEALIRWNDPQTGLVPPGRFIPVLEETGLIYDVGRWALRKALAEHLRWRDAGLGTLRIAVNVSPLQLRNRGFIAELRQVIGIAELAANGLELEITESLIMEDVKHNIASLRAIRDMGVRIAIDDFGTGFSSLSYLSKLPVHTLKIDRSFVIDMTLGPDGLSLVSTIIQLAHSLKLKVVAEGVETGEQSRLLRLLNCDEMQGFLFSKPVPCEEFEARFLAAPAVVAA